MRRTGIVVVNAESEKCLPLPSNCERRKKKARGRMTETRPGRSIERRVGTGRGRSGGLGECGHSTRTVDPRRKERHGGTEGRKHRARRARMGRTDGRTGARGSHKAGEGSAGRVSERVVGRLVPSTGRSLVCARAKRGGGGKALGRGWREKKVRQPNKKLGAISRGEEEKTQSQIRARPPSRSGYVSRSARMSRETAIDRHLPFSLVAAGGNLRCPSVGRSIGRPTGDRSSMA